MDEKREGTVAMAGEVVETDAARFMVDENEIFHISYKAIESIGIAESIDEIEHCKSMNKKLPLMAVVDISDVKSVSSESRDLYASERARSIYHAVALITRTPLSRVIGNFFLGINKPKMHIKLFSNTQLALEWLSTFKS